MAPALDAFHPATRVWFETALGAPTPPQIDGWRSTAIGAHTLIAAPTGSGKTLAAFLAAIDRLVVESRREPLPDETRVLYVSPLKALSHDIEKNLRAPLAGIDEVLRARGEIEHGIRVGLRTGDTPQKDRQRAVRRPPHIYVTTPESLSILLTSAGGRKILASVRTIILDEIHAIVGSKRGAHLALSIERLLDLHGAPVQRIGLSATQKPIEEVARFLVGSAAIPCTIVDTGHARTLDLGIELPRSPIEPVMANDVWGELHDRIAELVRAHKTTIVFVLQRRGAERLARALAERLSQDSDLPGGSAPAAEVVTAHHGSMSREMRLEAEQRLKSGALRCIVATSSLELGIDVGHVDLVIQIGSPRSIAGLIQRVGRSGHFLGGLPKGRVFPISRDDLVESLALFDAISRGELDTVSIPEAPLDVLAQQIVAEVAGAGDAVEIERLWSLTRRAWPYRALDRHRFDQLIASLGDAWGVRRGRRGASVHADAANGVLRPRRGARMLATSSGGAIPDNAAYDVVLEPEGQRIGNVHEDFAIESMPGDVFQLGNASWRILRVQPGVVRVEDAKGQPPTLPFWLGEGPTRTAELSFAVGRLIDDLEAAIRDKGPIEAAEDLARRIGVPFEAARQVCEYLAEALAALGTLPDGRTIVAERFFDEAENTHLVIHTRLGGRINRAWGLALRKSFCRSFDFELQAAANDDAIVLSLGPRHSFPLDEVFGFVKSKIAEHTLTQAVLDAPLFGTRWRWAATIALAVPRARGGKKSPPARQRIDAEDLLSVVFPDAQACFENIQGEREVPDHPLVQQALCDCLTEAMDVRGLVRVLESIESGAIRCLARDLPQPSALAAEILGARPWAFLDDAPLEERRTQAVMMRRIIDPGTDLSALDPAAIARVREEAWPEARDADELHDAIGTLGFLRDRELRAEQREWLAELGAAGRIARAEIAGGIWVAAERLEELLAIHAAARLDPPIRAASLVPRAIEREGAIRELVRSRLEGLGPSTVRDLADSIAVETGEIDGALAALEAEGFVMRGRYSPGANEMEWCERRLLARIHRATIQRLRREIEPVSAADYVRFLCDWQRLSGASRARGGEDALWTVLQQLEGFEAPAAAWEDAILPARVGPIDPRALDALFLSGRIAWARGGAPTIGSDRAPYPVRSTRIVIVDRERLDMWAEVRPAWPELSPMSPAASAVHAALLRRASFLHEIERATGLSRDAVELGLGELVARGAASSDAWSGLRALIAPREERGGGARERGPTISAIESAGRWSLVASARTGEAAARLDERALEACARVLLRRWGVIVRRAIEREGMAPPWRDLVRVLRRLEARGEIRGGRFVAGQAGEQFALPEAVGALREVRRRRGTGEAISISAADPLNLIGLVTPGARVPSIASHRIVLCDGVPIAVRDGEGVRSIAPESPAMSASA